MLTQFKIAGGTVVGRDHVGLDGLLKGKNNQDAMLISANDLALVGVVCDGCGQHDHSEIGAQLTARLLLNAVLNNICGAEAPWSDTSRADFWKEVQRSTLFQLSELARAMAAGGSYSAVVNEYFLCTALVVLVTPEETQIAAVGDGLYAVNGTETDLGPFPNNEPPYLAYQMVPRKNTDTQAASNLTLQKVISTSDVQSLLIGTDGVRDYRKAVAEGKTFPGGTRELPPLSDFWTLEHYTTNPDGIGRTLRLANTDKKYLLNGKLVYSPGLLKDDTTFVVVQRSRTVDP